MIRSKKIKIITLITLIVIITTLSIAYAVLSTTLNIVGTSEVKATAWNVYFSNVDILEQNGNATVTMPTISGTAISNYNVGLQTPGDSVTFSIYIKNDSDLNATVSSIVNSTPVCTSATGNTADADLVCNNLIYEYKLYGNFNLEVGDTLIPTIEGDQSALICNKTSEEGTLPSILYLTIGFDSNATSVPSNKVSVSNLSNQIIFTQGEECPKGEGGTSTTEMQVTLITKNVEAASFNSEVYVFNATYPINILYELDNSSGEEVLKINETQEIEQSKYEKTFTGLDSDAVYTLTVTTTDSEGKTATSIRKLRVS